MLLASPGACFKLFQEKRKWGHGRALLFKGVVGKHQGRVPQPSLPAPSPKAGHVIGLERRMENSRAGPSPKTQEPHCHRAPCPPPAPTARGWGGDVASFVGASPVSPDRALPAEGLMLCSHSLEILNNLCLVCESSCCLPGMRSLCSPLAPQSPSLPGLPLPAPAH